METTNGLVIIEMLRAYGKYLSKTFLLLICFLFSFQLKAQLVINEVSQGASGSKEYVEFLVTGTPTCTTIPCVDLRGYIIDDNNGTFAIGAGTGIADGCIKLTNDPLWSCVPAGTLLVIYNDADLNPLVPAQDLSLTDGNCKLVIPISNCTLFDKNTTQPSVGTSAYPAAGFAACGNWTEISMANSDDSFQTRDATGTLIHAVSWGNNTLANIIYFASSSAGDVSLMTNSIDNNPSNQANWLKVGIAGNETPGAPNNAANAAWINSMNNSCGTILPLTLSFATLPTACACSGSATVTASGAVGPYTYTWSPIGINTDTIGSLCLGNYSVSVGSANGCLVTDTVSITSSIVLTTVITTTDVTCNGNADGLANVTVSGSAGPFTYTWTAIGGNNAASTNLPAGNYTLSVAQGSCTTIATTIINEPPVLTATISSTDITCFGLINGTATVSANGGTGAYTYSWSPSGGTNATATNLSQGNYTVTVTDANGCTVNAFGFISEPAIISLTITSTSVTCNGLSNGTASVSATGGAGAYTYTWSPTGGNTNNATGLPQGNYFITVNDANGCVATASVIVNQPTPITVTVTTTNAGCNTNNGTATANTGGGTGALTYSWIPSGGNTNTAVGLAPGNYSVTITDANNCSVTSNTTITQPPSFTIMFTSVSVTCNGGSDGSLTANIVGGTAPFNYQWLPTGGTNATTGNILTAGTYSVNVTDAGACSATTTITLTQPIPVTVSASGQTVCNGQSASLTATGSGGNGAPYTYTWNTGATGSPLLVNTTVNTTYSVIATDFKSCVSLPDTAMVNILTPLSIIVVSNDTTCAGQPGKLIATPAGGNGNYTITWLPSNANGNSIIVNPITTTIYTATVTDGCTATPASATGQVTVLLNPIINFNPNPASGCAPVCATFAAVASNVAGNNIVSYAWNFGDGGTANGLNAAHCYTNSGSYNVYLLGITQMGCRDSVLKNSLITVFSQPVAGFNASNFTPDIYDPTVTFYDVSQGGVTNWHWNFQPGTSTTQNPSHTFPAEGTYSVTLIVTNANGCADTITKEIIVKQVFTFYAPNAFTPNFDGTNDNFLPIGTAWDFSTYNLWVFDRWGMQLYHTSDANSGWNGSKRGEVLQEDVYVWKVELNDTFGKPHEYNGIISLVK